MTNKKTLSFLSLGMVAILGMSLVMAYQGDPTIQGPNFSEERHEAMQDAFETGDYNAWVTLMTENDRHPRIVEVITEDNFEDFIAARNDGTLREFRQSLDLGQGQMKHGNGKALGSFEKGFTKEARMGYKAGSHNCPLAE